MIVMDTKPSVAVLCPPDPVIDKLFQSVIGELASVSFIHGSDQVYRAHVIGRAEVVVTTSCSPEEICPEEASIIKPGGLLQLLFAGADNVPFQKLPETAMVACNSGAFAEPIAEHVLAMTLCLVKKILPRNEALKKGIFDQSGFNRTLSGKTCGIIGFGGNGKAVGRIMRAVGMKVAAVNRNGITDEKVEAIWSIEKIDDLLGLSDVLVLAVPLTGSTKGLIGKRELSLMKPDAILVNVARGAVVDQEALYERLCSHPDFGAAIDTWWAEPAQHGKFSLEHPLLDLPNFVGSPHVADNVSGMMPKAARKALENVRDFLKGNPVRGVLDRKEYILL